MSGTGNIPSARADSLGGLPADERAAVGVAARATDRVPSRIAEPFARSLEGRPALRLGFRLAWIAIRLLMVLWLAQRGLSFYYQGF
jgi:hypothetical protein